MLTGGWMPVMVIHCYADISFTWDKIHCGKTPTKGRPLPLKKTDYKKWPSNNRNLKITPSLYSNLRSSSSEEERGLTYLCLQHCLSPKTWSINVIQVLNSSFKSGPTHPSRTAAAIRLYHKIRSVSVTALHNSMINSKSVQWTDRCREFTHTA